MSTTTHPTTIDPGTHKAIVAHKLRVIDRRRAELEQLLAKPDGSFRTQELESERADLLALRVECERMLNPSPVPSRRYSLSGASSFASFERWRPRSSVACDCTLPQLS